MELNWSGKRAVRAMGEVFGMFLLMFALGAALLGPAVIVGWLLDSAVAFIVVSATTFIIFMAWVLGQE